MPKVQIPVAELYGELFRLNCSQSRKDKQADIIEIHLKKAIKTSGIPSYSIKKTVEMNRSDANAVFGDRLDSILKKKFKMQKAISGIF